MNRGFHPAWRRVSDYRYDHFKQDNRGARYRHSTLEYPAQGDDYPSGTDDTDFRKRNRLGLAPYRAGRLHPSWPTSSQQNVRMERNRISVLLADDNLIVREEVRAMLGVEPDLDVVGVASDYEA